MQRPILRYIFIAGIVSELFLIVARLYLSIMYTYIGTSSGDPPFACGGTCATLLALAIGVLNIIAMIICFVSFFACLYGFFNWKSLQSKDRLFLVVCFLPQLLLLVSIILVAIG